MKSDREKYQNELLNKTNAECRLLYAGLPIITLQKLAAESGYTEDALRSKISRGDFIEGVHFFKAPDGRIHFYVKEYLRWVESNRMEKASK